MKQVLKIHAFIMTGILQLALFSGNSVLCQTWQNPVLELLYENKSVQDIPVLLDSTVVEEYFEESQTWELSVKYAYSYNEEGDRSDKICFIRDRDTNIWDNCWKEDYTRDTHGYLLKSLFQVWETETGEWTETKMWEYTNDEQGNVLQYLFSLKNETDGEWIYSIKCLNRLNEFGKPDTSIRYQWDADATNWVKLSMEVTKYDIQGNLTEQLGFSWDTARYSWILKSGNFLTYSGNFLLTELLSLKWDTLSEQWNNDGRINYFYDDQDRCSGFLNFYWGEETEAWINSWKSDYTYDNDGNLSSESGYEWDETDSVWLFNQRRTHYYRSSDEPVEGLTDLFQKTLIYPNPAITAITLNTGINGPHHIRILNMDGRMVSEDILRGENNMLSLEGLKPSVYIIQVITPGERIRSLKLIKQ